MEVIKLRQMALNQIEAEIDGYTSADRRTFEMGRKVIETFHKAYNFMKLDGNWLAKIELAKLVLSNFSLQGRTLEFHYQKPFDELVKLVGVPMWWRRMDLPPTIVQQFGRANFQNITLLLAA